MSRTASSLDGCGEREEIGLEESDGDVDGVRAQAVDAEQELDRRLELPSQKQHLQQKFGTIINHLMIWRLTRSKASAVYFSASPYLEVEPRLLVGVEVTLAVLLGEQRLELRQGETLPRSSRRRRPADR